MGLAEESADLAAQIPAGRVAAFADVAEGLGDPRAAMAVFRIPKDAPTAGMHRVVRASAHVAFPRAAGLLRREGVPVSNRQVDDLKRHRWREFSGPRTLKRLREEQMRLAASVDGTDRGDEPERIAAFDVSYDGDTAFAAGVVTDVTRERMLQEGFLPTPLDFPYHPGSPPYPACPPLQ